MKIAPLVALALLAPASALAQDSAPPAGEARVPGAPPPPPERDATRVQVQLGGSWSEGNSRSYALNVAARLALRRGDNQLTASGQVSYSRVFAPLTDAPPGAAPVDVTSDSMFQAQLRYDRFFLDRNAVFARGLAFRDTSSGFAARWSGGFGYLRVLAARPRSHNLWVEGGYDLAAESLERDPEAVRAGLPGSRLVHLARSLVGFQAQPSEAVSADVAAEVQLDVPDPDDWRVNGVASLMARVAGDLHLGVNLNLRYLHAPVGAREPLDTSTQLVALYQHEGH